MALETFGAVTDPGFAGPSDANRHANPQLGPEPWFNYPKPTYEQLDEELPPYFEQENVSLGLMLERMTVKGYSDLRGLLEHSLPTSPLQHRPRLIIDYAKNQRQAFLKYLAILRWKASVDVPAPSSSQPAASFPTPQTNGSNGESSTTSPAADYNGKGKAKAHDQDDRKPALARGKVTDAKRVTLLMEHQNRQHEEALNHMSHITVVVDSLRERNPDLLTALSLLTTGTYNRLPTSLTEPYKAVKPLSNRAILRTLRRLNRHLLYRLRCVDHLPPEMIIEAVRDGKVYLGSGGQFGWKAQMTVVGFGEGDDARWWLTGVEWGWKSPQKGTDDPGGVRKLTLEEKEQILEIVNNGVLVPKPVYPIISKGGDRREMVDSPLNRLYNFLQHLSLSYQLETLFAQAMELSQGKWRGQLLVDLDRQAKALKVRYWVKQRPAQAPSQRIPSASLSSARGPLVGGTLRIALAETTAQTEGTEDFMRDIVASMESTESSERVLKLELGIRWEVGEAGAGGGLKPGDSMDSSILQIDPSNLSFQDILQTATRSHAAHLTRLLTEPLLASPRIALFPLNLPSIDERDAEDKPLSLRIPLPSRQKTSALTVSTSALTGLIEIEDEGASDPRAARARITSSNVNEHRGRLLDDLGRLITAVIAENLESQMRQLGWTPTRRLALRSDELNKHELHPATSIFVALPTSPLHYFMAKLGPQGITFELLKLVRVKNEKGLGMKLSVGDKIPMDLVKMRMRRVERLRALKGDQAASEATLSLSNYEIGSGDLKELFVFCNTLVAQTIVEQQLKDRSIPYTLQYPPPTGPGAASSTSAVAGMIPTICAKVDDLLKEGRANDVALPLVHIQLREWWKGGKCEVVTVIQLRHKPALASSETSTTSADHEDISFDPKTSVVRFHARDITRCVPSFLERWERLSKVLVVAGEVTRLNRSGALKDLHVLSFDLRTVTFAYAPGNTAAITYTPQDDSYQVSFSADQGTNPHDMLAGLLSHHLNELTREPKRVGKSSTGERFISLLCNTLPLLQEVERVRDGGDYPKMVVRSVTDFRLVWDVQNARRSIVDVVLRQGRFLMTDGSMSNDPCCGPITAIPKWQDIVSGAFDALKAGRMNGDSANSKGMAMKLDEGNSLVCGIDSIRVAVKTIAEGVKGAVGL